MESARHPGCNMDDLKLIHVPDIRPTSGACQVDLEKQALVKAPLTLREE